MIECRLIETGLADAVYDTKEHALAAVDNYNNRELDGKAYYLSLVSQFAVADNKCY